MSKLYSRVVTSENHHKNYQINIEEYSSANEVAKDCAVRRRHSGGFHAPDTDDRDWCGVDSYDEALELMRTGYEPVIKEFKEKVKTSAYGVSKRMAFQNNVQGFAPVVPLALKGVPNSMINVTIKPMKCKVIDVYYDMSLTCGYSSNDIMENGKNILGAIMALEAQGYKFNLYAVQHYADDRDCDMLVVKIKSSNQPFDLKKMSFPLVHTAFFRVIGFDWYSKTPNSRYRSGYGHSITREFGDEVRDVTKQLFNDGTVFFFGSEIVGRGQDYIKEVLLNAGNGKN